MSGKHEAVSLCRRNTSGEPMLKKHEVVSICDATPRDQAECEKNIFEIFAVLEGTHCPDHFGINFMKNGLIPPELQPMEKI